MENVLDEDVLDDINQKYRGSVASLLAAEDSIWETIKNLKENKWIEFYKFLVGNEDDIIKNKGDYWLKYLFTSTLSLVHFHRETITEQDYFDGRVFLYIFK